MCPAGLRALPPMAREATCHLQLQPSPPTRSVAPEVSSGWTSTCSPHPPLLPPTWCPPAHGCPALGPRPLLLQPRSPALPLHPAATPCPPPPSSARSAPSGFPSTWGLPLPRTSSPAPPGDPDRWAGPRRSWSLSAGKSSRRSRPRKASDQQPTCPTPAWKDKPGFLSGYEFALLSTGPVVRRSPWLARGRGLSPCVPTSSSLVASGLTPCGSGGRRSVIRSACILLVQTVSLDLNPMSRVFISKGKSGHGRTEHHAATGAELSFVAAGRGAPGTAEPPGGGDTYALWAPKETSAADLDCGLGAPRTGRRQPRK